MKILFDFENMAGRASGAMKYRIAQAFAKYNAPTASEGQPGGGGRAVEIDPTIRRSSGIPYREVLVLMKDGQRVILRVKAPGDVFQVTVNGRQIAIKNQDDHQAAIREIVDVLNSGRAKFQKRMATVRVPVKRGLAMSSRMQLKQMRAKVSVLDAMIEDAREELESLGVIEATPITQPDPVPVPTPDPAPTPEPAPTPDPMPAEDPAPTEPAADQWLRDVVEGRVKIEGNLKGWRDRIRAAMKEPATVELATAAYKILGAAALAEAQRIVGG